MMKDKSNSEAFLPKMGQGLSCGANQENGLFSAVKVGDIETVEALLKREPNLLYHTTVYDCHAALHIAAANGQIEILDMLLEKFVNLNAVNRHKQTLLALIAMHIAWEDLLCEETH